MFGWQMIAQDIAAYMMPQSVDGGKYEVCMNIQCSREYANGLRKKTLAR